MTLDEVLDELLSLKEDADEGRNPERHRSTYCYDTESSAWFSAGKSEAYSEAIRLLELMCDPVHSSEPGALLALKGEVAKVSRSSGEKVLIWIDRGGPCAPQGSVSLDYLGVSDDQYSDLGALIGSGRKVWVTISEAENGE